MLDGKVPGWQLALWVLNNNKFVYDVQYSKACMSDNGRGPVRGTAKPGGQGLSRHRLRGHQRALLTPGFVLVHVVLLIIITSVHLTTYSFYFSQTAG